MFGIQSMRRQVPELILSSSSHCFAGVYRWHGTKPNVDCRGEEKNRQIRVDASRISLGPARLAADATKKKKKRSTTLVLVDMAAAMESYVTSTCPKRQDIKWWGGKGLFQQKNRAERARGNNADPVGRPRVANRNHEKTLGSRM